MSSVQTVFTLVAVGSATLLTGCSSMEQKLGRGIANIMEPVRLGELTRSVEQTYLSDGPVVGESYGVVHGVSRTIQRTLVGVFDVATFPIPTDPLIQPSEPVFPDHYKPQLSGGWGAQTDRYLGLEGGGTLPWLAGSDFNPLAD